MEQIVERLKELMENEARSCSMDFGCITPEYVSRMWGGQYPMEEIDKALKELRASCYEL
jgi:hypothetical protein